MNNLSSNNMDLKSDSLIYKNMILFLLGKLVSLLGSRMMSFAIGLYVLNITGSAMSFALTMIISNIPTIILSPIAGALADQANRKLIVVLMDILSGIMLVGIFVLSKIYGLKLILIYSSTFFLSLFNTFFNVAMEASLPNIVDKKRLAKINSYNSSINSLATIVAPILGGLAYGLVNIESFIILSALSFILSGISEIFIDFELFRKEGENQPSLDRKNMFSVIIDGFKYVKTQKIIFRALIFSVFVNFSFSMFIVGLPYIVNTELGLSSQQYGLIQSAFAIGSLLFSIIFSIIADKKSGYFYTLLGFLISSIFMILTALPVIKPFINMANHFHLAAFMVINFVIGSAIVFVNLPFFIMLQKETPDEYRGRVSGLLGTLSLSIAPLGLLLGGLLADYLPSFIIPLISGGIFLGLTLVFSRLDDLKKAM